MTRRTAVAAILMSGGWVPLLAHPHDEPDIFEVKGTLTKVDFVNGVIEIDTHA